MLSIGFSDEVCVFCSSLSFQQAPVDVYISNRSWIMAGFVNSGEWEVQEEVEKKMGGVFNVRKHEKCKRKCVCFIRDKKIRGNRDYVENACFQTACHHINKEVDVSTEQWYIIKRCVRLTKSKVETIALLKEVF